MTADVEGMESWAGALRSRILSGHDPVGIEEASRKVLDKVPAFIAEVRRLRSVLFCGRNDLNLGGSRYVTCTRPVGHEGRCKQDDYEAVLQVIRHQRDVLKTQSSEGANG